VVVGTGILLADVMWYNISESSLFLKSLGVGSGILLVDVMWSILILI
jgi:hypothetical protein